MMDLIVLSDSDSNPCDDSYLPLSERILKLSQADDKKRKFTSIKTHHVSAHSMSDSEDEPQFNPNNKCSSDEDELPDLPLIPKIGATLPSSVECSLKNFTGLKLPSSPVSADLESDEESSQVLIKAPKRPKKIASKTKENSDLVKKEKQEQKIKEREQKKKEKELDKALKAAEREVKKNSKPEEYLKSMKVIVDGGMVDQADSSEFFNNLEATNLDYTIEANHIMQTIVWCRRVTHISVENEQVCKDESEELQSIMMLFIPNKDFVEMVHTAVQKNKGKKHEGRTLLDHLASIRAIFPLMDVTCVTVGLDKFLRENKGVHSDGGDMEKSSVKRVTKINIEEAMVEVQLQSFVNFKLLSSMKEFALLVHSFTKAIAGAPLKKEKNEQKALAFSWYADADSSCPVKLDKDGVGGIKLWKQQIQQFQLVGNQVADAIVSKYPSPRILLEAYRNCSSEQEAQKLLQDIVVRREYGPLGTQRRIGPELSYKIHLFFTSSSGNQLLER